MAKPFQYAVRGTPGIRPSFGRFYQPLTYMIYVKKDEPSHYQETNNCCLFFYLQTSSSRNKHFKNLIATGVILKIFNI